MIANLKYQPTFCLSFREQFFADIGGHRIVGREERTHNSGLAKVAVQCSADTFVINQTLVLRINICGKNRHLRQAAKR